MAHDGCAADAQSPIDKRQRVESESSSESVGADKTRVSGFDVPERKLSYLALSLILDTFLTM